LTPGPRQGIIEGDRAPADEIVGAEIAGLR